MLGEAKFTLLRIDPYDGFLQGRSKEDSRSVCAALTNNTVMIALGDKDSGMDGGRISATLSKVVDYVKKCGM